MIALAEHVRNARLQAVADALDDGSAAATLVLYDGAQPDPGAPITDQTQLAAHAFSRPAAATIESGKLTFAAIADAMAAAAGIAAWARAFDGAGAWVMDMDVGEAGSGAAVIISSTTLYAGALVRVVSATLTE